MRRRQSGERGVGTRPVRPRIEIAILLEDRLGIPPGRGRNGRSRAEHQDADESSLRIDGDVGIARRLVQKTHDAIDKAIDEAARPAGIDGRDGQPRAALAVGRGVYRNLGQRQIFQP